jgi:hypothetical protein
MGRVAGRGEIDTEALLAAQMEARTGGKGLTYIAFTATPKAKTLELFGRPGPDGLPQPFHMYSMKNTGKQPMTLNQDAIMDALEAHNSMSTQALGSERVREGLRDILLGPGQLYEGLRERSGGRSASS